jgi:hypothetical protein
VKPVQLLHIEGFLFGSREANSQPHLVTMEGDVWLPICRTPHELRALMRSIGVKRYKVGLVVNAASFWEDLDRSQVNLCVYRDKRGAGTRFLKVIRIPIRHERDY